MASEAAKRVAGTFILDDTKPQPPVLQWLREQARHGLLASAVQRFCAAQPEMLDPSLVQIESVTAECVHCRIPCRLYDHESASPFPSEVRFRLDPLTGEALVRVEV